MFQAIWKFLTGANIRKRTARAKTEADKPSLAEAIIQLDFSWADRDLIIGLTRYGKGTPLGGTRRTIH